MTGIRELPVDISMPTLWDELVFTWARLQARPATHDLAANFEALIARTEQTELAQRGHWRAEALGEAAVEVTDEDLNDVTADVVDEVRHTDRKKEKTREGHYLGSLTKGALIRLGLASQAERMAGWVISLESEAEETLRKLGKRLAKVIGRAGEVLTQRDSLAAARAIHRMREITSLIADVNATRRDTYGALVRLGNKSKRPKEWPESFFRHTSGKKTAAPTKPPAPDAPKE